MKIVNKLPKYEPVPFESLGCGTAFFMSNSSSIIYFKGFQNEIFYLDSGGIAIASNFFKNADLVRPANIKTIKFKFRKNKNKGEK